MIDMHGTMMENGLDYILDSVAKLKHYDDSKDPDEKRNDIKYSLLHLLSGIELVLKARLYVENWTYIFSRMDDADRNKLEAGNFNSIEFSKCIDRLERVCGVTIGEKDKKAFLDLKETRNKVEHFFVNESVEAVRSKIDKALAAVISFITNNYDVFNDSPIIDIRKEENGALSDTEKRYIEEINTKVAELASQYQKALDLAIKRAESVIQLEDLMICPNCGENVLVINDDDADNSCHCYFCNYVDNGATTARKFVSNVLRLDEYRTIKDGGEYPLYTCPDCGNNSLVRTDEGYVCFSCRMKYAKDEISECEECGELYTCNDDIDDGLCDNCKEWRREKTEKE